MSSLLDLHPEPADMARLVREGMARQPKQLPAWLLYDEEGSRLFEEITRLPEYYPTRQEAALLRDVLNSMPNRFAVPADCVNVTVPSQPMLR